MLRHDSMNIVRMYNIMLPKPGPNGQDALSLRYSRVVLTELMSNIDHVR
jgi:hypothetical protein